VVLGRMLDRPRLAVIAGVVFCLLPRTTWTGAEGRSYAASALLAAVMTLLLVRAATSDSRRPWIVYAAFVVVSCVLFLYLALVVVAHAATVAWWLARNRTLLRPAAAGWLRWAVIAAVTVTPFAFAVMGQSGQLHWLTTPDADTVAAVLQTQWFLTSWPFAIAGWIGIVAGGIALVRDSRGLSLAAVVIPAVVLPTAALLIVSALYTPIYTPRYLSMCLPFVALAIAAAIDSFRHRPARVVAVLLLAALAVPQVVEQRQPEAKEFTSWAEVADLIAAQRAADGADATTAIVYGNLARHPIASTRVIAYSYPDAFAGTIDVNIGVPAAKTGRLWETRIPLVDGLQRLKSADVVYLVTSITRDRRPRTTETLAGIGWHATEEWQLSEVAIVRYDRD
jgi:mannosyltransferase